MRTQKSRLNVTRLQRHGKAAEQAWTSSKQESAGLPQRAVWCRLLLLDVRDMNEALLARRIPSREPSSDCPMTNLRHVWASDCLWALRRRSSYSVGGREISQTRFPHIAPPYGLRLEFPHPVIRWHTDTRAIEAIHLASITQANPYCSWTQDERFYCCHYTASQTTYSFTGCIKMCTLNIWRVTSGFLCLGLHVAGIRWETCEMWVMLMTAFSEILFSRF